MLIAQDQVIKKDNLEITVLDQTLTVRSGDTCTEILFSARGEIIEKEQPKPEKKAAEVKTKVVGEPGTARPGTGKF